MLRGQFCFLPVLGLLLSSILPLYAQTGAAVQAAVAPIATAKSVYLGSGGGGCPAFSQFSFTDDGNRAYDSFRAALLRWNKLRLAASPAQADLDAEITLKCPVPPPGSTGKMIGLAQTIDSRVRLELRIWDVKTRLPVWTLTEFIAPALLQRNRDRNFDRAMRHLVSRFEALNEGQSDPGF